MAVAKVMWVDDEMESLEAHRRFLELKGYELVTFTNGWDALDFLSKESVDVVCIDESMPGMGGLETLSRIKQIHAQLPVILVTKNETESLMEEAIGSQISDYLIKPVHPQQVLLSLKKILDNKRLVSERTTVAYQQQFRTLLNDLEGEPDPQTWINVYNQLIYWELAMAQGDSAEMLDIHAAQKREANALFFKYVSKNYASWIQVPDERSPLMSHQFVQKKLLPHLQSSDKLVWIVVDNLRYDQLKVVEPLLNQHFKVLEESAYFSLLPTATHYCRNALFAGLLPSHIQQQYPDKWVREDDDQGKNLHEEFFLREQLKRSGFGELNCVYKKITDHAEAVRLSEHALELLDHDLSVVVYNFVDTISHARNEIDVLKELASDAVSYRSLTQTWFTHSPLFTALKKLAERKCTIVITTDHGSIQVKHPIRVTADRQSTSNLRYKNGKNLDFDPRQVYASKDPVRIGLPQYGVNSSYVFAGNEDFICYPNNFNHYATLYKNTFQHGGISMEEMILPTLRLTGKSVHL